MKPLMLFITALLFVSSASGQLLKYEISGVTNLGENFILRIGINLDDGSPNPLNSDYMQSFQSTGSLLTEFMDIQFVVDGVDYFYPASAAAAESMRQLFMENGSNSYHTYESSGFDVEVSDCSVFTCGPEETGYIYQVFWRETFEDFDMSSLYNGASSSFYSSGGDAPHANVHSFFEFYTFHDEPLFTPGDLLGDWQSNEARPLESWGTISLTSYVRGCTDLEISLGCRPFIADSSINWSREFSAATIRRGWTDMTATVSEGALAPLLGMLLWVGLRRRK